MSPLRDTPRLFREAFDRYARVAVFALVLVPILPDVATDFAAGDWPSGLLRLGVVGVLATLAVVLLWASRKRSVTKQAQARDRMATLDRCDILVLPLSLSRGPLYRAAGREQAESVPELLIDGHGALDPGVVVVVRSPQIDESDYQTFVDNLSKARPNMRILPAPVTTVHNPTTVFTEVRNALIESLPDELDNGATVAVDVTGGTALMSLGLAKLANDLNAQCVYISGTRGEYGRYEIGTQNRHSIDLVTLFG